MSENFRSRRIKGRHWENGRIARSRQIKVLATTWRGQGRDIKHASLLVEATAKLQEGMVKTEKQMPTIAHWTNRRNQDTEDFKRNLPGSNDQDSKCRTEGGHQSVHPGIETMQKKQKLKNFKTLLALGVS